MTQLEEQTWVLEGPTNIGFIVDEGEVYLVDSGNDKDAGRRINKILKERNWRLKAVINTHSNADHIGGNDYLQRNLDCEIYASETERAFIESPELETAFLWGGKEIKSLRNKFFQAKPSRVTKLLEGETLSAQNIGIISLKGHFFNMIGVRSPDNVLFAADCLFGTVILEKYRIPFIYDVKAFKETLIQLKSDKARFFVPSHGPIVRDITETADRNLGLVDEIEEALLSAAEEESGFDLILKKTCDRFGIELNAGQYALVGSTIRSFLTYLNDEGKIGFQFRDNVMLWKRGH